MLIEMCLDTAQMGQGTGSFVQKKRITMVPGMAEEKIYVKSVDCYLMKCKTDRSCAIIFLKTLEKGDSMGLFPTPHVGLCACFSLHFHLFLYHLLYVFLFSPFY